MGGGLGRSLDKHKEQLLAPTKVLSNGAKYSDSSRDVKRWILYEIFSRWAGQIQSKAFLVLSLSS